MTYEDICVAPGQSILETMRVIDRMGTQLAVVVDRNDILLGTVTDGDVRRALLAGAGLSDPVKKCVHPDPLVAPQDISDRDALRLMRDNSVHQIVMVDRQGRFKGLKLLDELFTKPRFNNPVVLMVGGLGKRLGDLTSRTPKPMLPLGDKPVLEHIVQMFVDAGFSDIRMAVNYRAEQIEAHFGDGQAFGCNISYLREEKRLGTAGALGLLPDAPDMPIIVSNGDLLLQIDLAAMLAFHERMDSVATMAVRDYEVQIPYGVVEAEDGGIRSITEKPINNFLISAGLYVLSPMVLPLIERETYLDTPDLFRRLIDNGERTAAYRMDGYWLDIGRRADYERARQDFGATDVGDVPRHA